MSKSKALACICAVFCTLALAFCFTGCGKDYTQNFAGTWYVTSMQDSNGVDRTPVIEQLNAANKRFELTLSDDKDKTATFNMADQTILNGTWKPTSESSCTISFEGYEDSVATLEDGKLSFDESGQTMTCEKLE